MPVHRLAARIVVLDPAVTVLLARLLQGQAGLVVGQRGELALTRLRRCWSAPEVEGVGSFRAARDGRSVESTLWASRSEAFRMRIANVLRAKGSVVATVTPDTSVADGLAVMAEHSVGAVVVVRDGAVVGMVWERDVISHLHQRGTSLVGAPISEIMNPEVVSCVLTDEVDGILRTMTDRRIRHLPVMVGNELSGIVSMGDLVKARIGELEAERGYLQSYIAT